ncbi:MAG TPA: 16S rRNA (guanine(966)-N(2))-methyltransferase RsmD [Bacteroidales bacterium]|nr:16S rRNA (guanine(966)-N(2))-methyltransferase RsmD [Bacteroidales bacterium]
MRIISGQYKGKQINPPSGFSARPTTDYARESLFNILSNRIDFESLAVLDLFSGTGSISYEFASRGAKTIHLVEQDMNNIRFIRKMLNEMNLRNIKALHLDARDFLKTCKTKYDIVFADPPYDLPWLKKIPELVSDADILSDDGFFILEHPRDISFSGTGDFFEHRNYGSVNFSFFRKKS